MPHSFVSADVLERADVLAQRYGGRPSAYLDLTLDPWAAFCVDEAAAVIALFTANHTTSTSPRAPDTGAAIEAGPGGLTLNGFVPIIPHPNA